MVLVLMTPYLDTRATFLDPPRSLATIPVYQTLDVPDAIALRNHTRLGKQAWRERDNRTGSFCHGAHLPVGCFCSKQASLFLPLLAEVIDNFTRSRRLEPPNASGERRPIHANPGKGKTRIVWAVSSTGLLGIDPIHLHLPKRSPNQTPAACSAAMPAWAAASFRQV